MMALRGEELLFPTLLLFISTQMMLSCVSGFVQKDLGYYCNTRTSSTLEATNNNVQAFDGPDLPPIGPNTKRLFLVRHGEGRY